MEEALRSIYDDGLAVEADAKKHKLGFCDLFHALLKNLMNMTKETHPPIKSSWRRSNLNANAV
eukprot:scaffold4279_cov123-Ochromonas_danica.AAC.1